MTDRLVRFNFWQRLTRVLVKEKGTAIASDLPAIINRDLRQTFATGQSCILQSSTFVVVEPGDW